jgi:cytochrome oxidase Cu insertion factor (SCO1/SenC/PrrC family)
MNKIGFATVFLATAAVAQMEKRTADLYDPAMFAAAAPAVGTDAPDLQLCDLQGRPRCLQALLGKTVVIVKGSYT